MHMNWKTACKQRAAAAGSWKGNSSLNPASLQVAQRYAGISKGGQAQVARGQNRRFPSIDSRFHLGFPNSYVSSDRMRLPIGAPFSFSSTQLFRRN